MRRAAVKNRTNILKRCDALLEEYGKLVAKSRDGVVREGAYVWIGAVALLFDAAFPSGHPFCKAASDAVAKPLPPAPTRLHSLVVALRRELAAGVFGDVLNAKEGDVAAEDAPPSPFPDADLPMPDVVTE